MPDMKGEGGAQLGARLRKERSGREHSHREGYVSTSGSAAGTPMEMAKVGTSVLLLGSALDAGATSKRGGESFSSLNAPIS